MDRAEVARLGTKTSRRTSGSGGATAQRRWGDAAAGRRNLGRGQDAGHWHGRGQGDRGPDAGAILFLTAGGCGDVHQVWATIEHTAPGDSFGPDGLVAVVDGAAWCQGFLDTQRNSMRSGCLTSPPRWSTWGRWRTPSTGRHVFCQRVAFGRAAGPGVTPWRRKSTGWSIGSRRSVESACTAESEARTLIQQNHDYLAARIEQIRYDTFVAAGESDRQWVCGERQQAAEVEARLKVDALGARQRRRTNAGVADTRV